MSGQTRGIYRVIEGPDGAGKSTQCNMLVDRLIAEGRQAISVHEPGETPIGREIEKIIKNRDLGRTALSNLLFFTINRLELWKQKLEQALDSGTDVVSERNWLSSLVYQGHAEKMGFDFVTKFTANFLPERYMTPDLTIILATSGMVRQQRMLGRGGSENDAFESRGSDFQAKLTEGYDIIASSEIVKNLVVISVEGTSNEVHEAVWKEVKRTI